MSIGKAIAAGLGRAISTKRLILWLWLLNFAVAVPVAWQLGESLRSSIGASLVHEKLRAGFDLGWFGEFEAAAEGLETSFTPTVLGAGAFYNNLEAWITGELFGGIPGLVGFGLLYALIWAFMLGGVLERFAREDGPFLLSHFFSTGAKFFFRFLRLALISGILYYALYRFGGWLFRFIENATRDVTVERTVLVVTLAGVALVVFLLCLANMAFDYAKIAMVLESRRSAILAALRGLGFVLSNPGKTLGIYYGLGAVGIALLAVYALIAPGATQSTPLPIVLAFLLGQAFLVARLVLRLAFYAAQMAFYDAANRPPGGGTSPVESETAAAVA
jgi:hypothetical protein